MKAKLWEITDDGSISDLRGALAKKTKENLKGEKQKFKSYVDVLFHLQLHLSFVIKLRADVNQLLRAVMSNMLHTLYTFCVSFGKYDMSMEDFNFSSPFVLQGVPLN